MLVVNIYKDPYDVYIGRAGKQQSGLFGNPVAVSKQCPVCKQVHTSGAETLPCYKKYLWHRLENEEAFKKSILDLQGKTLGCFCAPKGGITATDPHICHGQVILSYLNWANQQKP
jgi:hypothetical protein